MGAVPPVDPAESETNRTRSLAETLVCISDRIDAGMAALGRLVALFGFVTVLLCFATVYLRYALGIGFTWLQELYVWSHVVVIMFGSGYCLLKGGFVRVDMFYEHMSAVTKAKVDLFGAAFFTTPFLIMAGIYGWPFFLASYQMNERSSYDDGLSRLYLLKGTLMIFAVIVAIQLASTIARNLSIILISQKSSQFPQ